MTGRELEMARADLAAARHLLDGGFASQALSRAYYAMFHAASAALALLGEVRSKHSGVLSAFRRHVVDAGFPKEAADDLRLLFAERNDADYGGHDVTEQTAGDRIERAKRFVEAVERWVAER